MNELNGWTKSVRKFHNDLKSAMKPYAGERLKTKEIKEIISSTTVLKHDAQFILPSDHCINHTNKGACDCSLHDEAIFEKIERGLYLVRNI